MQPSLDDLQQALNRATVCVFEVSRGIAQWGQKRFKVIEPSQDGDHHIKGKPHSATGHFNLDISKLLNYYLIQTFR